MTDYTFLYIFVHVKNAFYIFLFTVDGQYCMTCGSDKMIRLWNPRSGVMLKSYSGHGYEVLDCKASCDNANMCSCGMDKTVIYWDVASGNVLRKYRGHAGIFTTGKRSCGKAIFLKTPVCSEGWGEGGGCK